MSHVTNFMLPKVLISLNGQLILSFTYLRFDIRYMISDLTKDPYNEQVVFKNKTTHSLLCAPYNQVECTSDESLENDSKFRLKFII